MVGHFFLRLPLAQNMLQNIPHLSVWAVDKTQPRNELKSLSILDYCAHRLPTVTRQSVFKRHFEGRHVVTAPSIEQHYDLHDASIALHGDFTEPLWLGLFPEQDTMRPISTRLLHRVVVDAPRAEEGPPPARGTNQAMNFKEDVPSLREGSLHKAIDAGIFSKKDEKISGSYQRASRSCPADDVTVMAAACVIAGSDGALTTDMPPYAVFPSGKYECPISERVHMTVTTEMKAIST